MADSDLTVVNVKNQWLSNQVAVEHPTPESLQGRDVYFNMNQGCTVTPLPQIPLEIEAKLEEIFLVDFHRLTVMFSLLEASRANSEQDKNLLLEFFTQIIFSEPCFLYVGFHQSEPTAAAIVTVFEDQLLVSDVVINNPQEFGDIEQFANTIVVKWKEANTFEGAVYLEK